MCHAYEFSEAIIASGGFVNWIEPSLERHKSERNSWVNAFSDSRSFDIVTLLPCFCYRRQIGSTFLLFFFKQYPKRYKMGESVRFISRTSLSARQCYINSCSFEPFWKDIASSSRSRNNKRTPFIVDIIRNRLFNYRSTWPANHTSATLLLTIVYYFSPA